MNFLYMHASLWYFFNILSLMDYDSDEHDDDIEKGLPQINKKRR